MNKARGAKGNEHRDREADGRNSRAGAEDQRNCTREDDIMKKEINDRDLTLVDKDDKILARP